MSERIVRFINTLPFFGFFMRLFVVEVFEILAGGILVAVLLSTVMYPDAQGKPQPQYSTYAPTAVQVQIVGIDRRIQNLEDWRTKHDELTQIALQRLTKNEEVTENLTFLSRATLGGVIMILLSAVLRFTGKKQT